MDSKPIWITQIGSYIALLREDRDWSLSTLARRAGIATGNARCRVG